MRFYASLVALCLAASAQAAVAPAMTIERGQVITAADLTEAEQAAPGAPSALAVIGKQAVRRLVAGRAIRDHDVRDPLAVERGRDVTLVWKSGPLEITATGKAVSSGAVGEDVRVQAAGSRAMLTGTISGAGRVTIQ